MKKKLLAVFGVLTLTLVSGPFLFAGNDYVFFKKSNITIDKVINSIKTQKLTFVKEIKFDDGAWEVKTQEKNSETKYIYNNTDNLKQLKQESESDLQPPADLNSLEKAVKSAQDKGFNVSSVEYEGKYWEVEGYDNKDLKHVVLVDDTGKVLKTSIDD